MIEFDVDMGYLLDASGLDCVVLNDENGEHEPMTLVPMHTCRLTNEDGTNDWGCSACGDTFETEEGEPPTWMSFCPICGARIVEFD